MVHLHEVKDTDTHFVIDPITRSISNPNSAKNKLMQGDHNSEIYTFELPKLVEGHDMSLCDKIRIHYNDISSDRANQSKDVYEVDDIHIDEIEADTLVFSWRISSNATKYAGMLSFRIQFLCIGNDNSITYAWHTDIFKGITVSDGFDNAEAVVEEYSDVLAQWEARIEALEQGGKGGTPDAVQFIQQDLTEEQQAQARQNIGAASTGDIGNIKTGLDCVTATTKMLSPVEFEVRKGYMLLSRGTVEPYSNDSYCVSSNVPVTPGETLYITASEHFSNAYYAFYDKDNKPILIRSDNSMSDTATPIVDEEVVVPEKAETIIIAYFGKTVGAIKRIIPDGGLKLQPWKGRIWTVVGDSLTEKNGRTDMNYHDYVAEATGITVINQGYSGSGYAKTGAGQAFHLRITNVSPDSDAVTIFGSFNDFSSGLELGTAKDTGTETICGCINTTIDNLIAVMPAVSLGIVTPTAWQNGDPSNPDNSQTKYADALVEICKNRSIPCLDLYRCSNLRPWTEEGRLACYTKDDGNGVHPDETGHRLIAARFKAFLESLIM